MPTLTITLNSVPGGWCVSSELCGLSLMFLSVGDAEAQAVRLAQLAARLGREPSVRVIDRRGRTLGHLAPMPSKTASPRIGSAAIDLDQGWAAATAFQWRRSNPSPERSFHERPTR